MIFFKKTLSGGWGKFAHIKLVYTKHIHFTWNSSLLAFWIQVSWPIMKSIKKNILNEQLWI